ncbi:MAG: hypothetical protein U1D96_04695 [Eubacteriales bacterium]|nr:hypothetical protein [Eubacteriales bacterium]MDZ4042777.1 hypothetical protein [Eubacteriales bacterium]
MRSPVQDAGGEGWLPYQYELAGTWPVQVRGRMPIDPDSPSLIRDVEIFLDLVFRYML